MSVNNPETVGMSDKNLLESESERKIGAASENGETVLYTKVSNILHYNIILFLGFRVPFDSMQEIQTGKHASKDDRNGYFGK